MVARNKRKLAIFTHFPALKEGRFVERAQFPAVEPFQGHATQGLHRPDSDFQMAADLGIIEL